MKRLLKFLLTLTLVFTAFSCTSLRDIARREEAAKYNDIRATFITTQGDISFYLYPEAAPITVANFINLAQRGFYNNTKIHRAVENFVVQGGDPTGTGTGGPGYSIPDEYVEWLDFFQQGMLAMANAGPNTGGSQYFITLYPAEWLNGRHTIFGEYVSDIDFDRIRKLEVGDVIKEIRFSGDIDFFLSLHKEQIDEWNKILDTTYPGLKEYPVKPIEEYQGEALEYKEELTKIYTRQEVVEEDKEWPIPRLIRAVEKKIKGDGEETPDSYEF